MTTRRRRRHRRRLVGEIRPSAAVVVAPRGPPGRRRSARMRISALACLLEEPTLLLYSPIPIRPSAERATLHSATIRRAVLSRQYHTCADPVRLSRPLHDIQTVVVLILLIIFLVFVFLPVVSRSVSYRRPVERVDKETTAVAAIADSSSVRVCTRNK